MRFKTVGNKRDVVGVVIKNAETSSDIGVGRPVTLALNGTDDGVAVVLPGTAGDAKNGAFKYGICLGDISVGEYGESQVFGYNEYAIIVRATRAASSDSFTSYASLASGIALGYDSINNCLIANASMVGSLGTLNGAIVLAKSLASGAASATATNLTGTVVTGAAKVFLRMM